MPAPASWGAGNGLRPPQDSPWGISETPQNSPWDDFGEAVGSLKMANSVGPSPWAASQSALWPASSTQESQEPLLQPCPSSQLEHQPLSQPGIERVLEEVSCVLPLLAVCPLRVHKPMCAANDHATVFAKGYLLLTRPQVCLPT